MVKSLANRTLGKSGIKISVIGTGLWSPRRLPDLMLPLTKEEYGQIDSVTPPGGGREIWPA
jgi:hypothetical protein